MKKEEIIEKIKNIIQEFGSFGTGEVQADCSPCVASMGSLVSLAEEFNLETVFVEVYDGEENNCNSIESYTLTYEQLEEDTLNDILKLAEQYKEDQE